MCSHIACGYSASIGQLQNHLKNQCPTAHAHEVARRGKTSPTWKCSACCSRMISFSSLNCHTQKPDNVRRNHVELLPKKTVSRIFQYPSYSPFRKPRMNFPILSYNKLAANLMRLNFDMFGTPSGRSKDRRT